MPKPKYFTITPVDDADGIATSQTPAAGGVQSLTLTDSPVVYDTPHKVIITAVGDESGRTIAVIGNDISGQPVIEEITGPDATTAETVNYFTSISDVTVDDDTAGALAVGTSGLCSSPWYPVNRRSGDFGIAFSCELAGSAAMTYGVLQTFDDLQDNDALITSFDHASVASETTSQHGDFSNPPRGIRCEVSAFTSGVLQFNIHEKG